MYAIQLLYLFDEIRIIFEPLRIAIFQLCLLQKMRLSVDLEGRFTGYKSIYLLCGSKVKIKANFHRTSYYQNEPLCSIVTPCTAANYHFV